MYQDDPDARITNVLKAAVISFLHEVKVTTLKINDKIEVLKRKNIYILYKNQMTALELNNIITEIKNSLDALKSQIEATGEGGSEFEDK